MQKTCCIALAFDRNMFHQAKACINTIHKNCRYDATICALALDLPLEQLDWLKDHGVVVRTDYSGLPRFKDLPLYAYAQICRPYLKDLFPGYLIYMWVDADIRFIRADAFDAYIGQAAANPTSIVISQEIENSYICIHSAEHVRRYHEMKNERLQPLYDVELLKKIQYYYTYNTGIWGMHRDSEIWQMFKSELMKTFNLPFNHMREQDALNIAILKWGGMPVNLPATMNWLCALSIPGRDPESGAPIRPIYPHWPISVLHLIMSQSPVAVDGVKMPFYELYRRMNFTE